MALLQHYELADIHRQVCVSILDSYLPHGSKGGYAESVGISSQWYSYIRQPGSFAMPDAATAKLMADALPAPEYYKKAFLHHLLQARRCYDETCEDIREQIDKSRPLSGTLDALWKIFKKSYFSSDAYEIQYSLRASLELAHTLIQFVPPEIYCLEFLSLCSLLSRACIVLDLLSDGLFAAKVGSKSAEHLDKSYFRTPTEYAKFEVYKYQLSQDEGVGYYYLNNVKQAKQMFDFAESLLPAPCHSERAELMRYRLMLLSKSPRFVLGDAEFLADKAIEIYIQSSSKLEAILVQEALAQAYIAYGTSNSLKKATRLVEDILVYVQETPNLGNLHKTNILRTAARLAFRKGDLDKWELLTNSSITIAQNSGLRYEQRISTAEYNRSTRDLPSKLELLPN